MSRFFQLFISIVVLVNFVLAGNWTATRISVPYNASSPSNVALQIVLSMLDESVNRKLSTAPPVWVYGMKGSNYGMVVTSERGNIDQGRPTPKTERMRKVRDAALRDYRDEASLSIFLAWLLNVPHLEWHPKLPVEKQIELMFAMKRAEADFFEVDRSRLKRQVAQQFDTSVKMLDELVKRGLEEVKTPGREMEAEIIRETIEARDDYEHKKDCVRRHAYTECWNYFYVQRDDSDEEKGLAALAAFLHNSLMSGLWEPLDKAGITKPGPDGKFTEEQMEQMMPVWTVLAEASGMLEDVKSAEKSADKS